MFHVKKYITYSNLMILPLSVPIFPFLSFITISVLIAIVIVAVVAIAIIIVIAVVAITIIIRALGGVTFNSLSAIWPMSLHAIVVISLIIKLETSM
jgi:hypothetical protein